MILRRPVATAGALLVVASTTVLHASPANAQPVNAHSVSVAVVDVTPTTPAATTTAAPITITLALTNNTDQNLVGLQIDGARGNPLTTRTELDYAIRHPAAPDPSLIATITTPKPVTTGLGPRGTATVTFTATSSTDFSTSPGLCICETRIYPLYFTVHAHDPSGADVVVGTAQTFVPAFNTPPAHPVQVSWVWPIIDRPHRLVGDTTFIDDDLAYSVAGGRLDRVLQVVEGIAQQQMALTVVIDPELLDELAVMAAGKYVVDTGGKQTAGSGTDAAKLWLGRLRDALALDPRIELDFTPLADPDVESLSSNNLAWTTGLAPQVQARIAAVLPGHTPGMGVAWPVDGVLTGSTLDQLVRAGATSVIVSDTVLPNATDTGVVDQLGILQSPAGQVAADVTQSSIQSYVADVMNVGGAGTQKLPELVSEVAVAEMSQPQSSPYVTIVAPRTVNPLPDVAERAIEETARTSWSTSITLGSAAHAVTASDHGQLVQPRGHTGQLSDATIEAARTVSHLVPALATMMSTADASRLLGSLPVAVQRAESSAWRTDPVAGDSYARQLGLQIEAIESGVRIVHPSTGTYTLTSSNSPLPITVENTLGVTVKVRVQISAANDLPGFSPREGSLETIAPNTKVTLHIPTHVERTGRFQVLAVLVTPSNVQIGDSVRLSVHSTALGTIGVVITVVAAVVLVIALLVRLLRRLRAHGRAGQVGS